MLPVCAAPRRTGESSLRTHIQLGLLGTALRAPPALSVACTLHKRCSATHFASRTRRASPVSLRAHLPRSSGKSAYLAGTDQAVLQHHGATCTRIVSLKGAAWLRSAITIPPPRRAATAAPRPRCACAHLHVPGAAAIWRRTRALIRDRDPVPLHTCINNRLV